MGRPHAVKCRDPVRTGREVPDLVRPAARPLKVSDTPWIGRPWVPVTATLKVCETPTRRRENGVSTICLGAR